jgi:hypothetical protein
VFFCFWTSFHSSCQCLTYSFIPAMLCSPGTLYPDDDGSYYYENTWSANGGPEGTYIGKADHSGYYKSEKSDRYFHQTAPAASSGERTYYDGPTDMDIDVVDDFRHDDSTNGHDYSDDWSNEYDEY